MATSSSPAPLYQHEPHPHFPRSANERHHDERMMAAGQSRLAAFNETLAVWITAHVGTMLCTYIFFAIGVGSLVGVFTNNALLAAVCGSVSSYLLQLILLPLIQMGSNLLSRHAELQADEQFRATTRTLHESEQMMRHLNAQDAELLKQTAMLAALVERQAAATPVTSASIILTPTLAEPAPFRDAPTAPPKRSHKRKVATS